MDHKPLITYAGDINVFQSVAPSLQKGIGTEAVEWKRAYGRTTKHVHLHPRFIPFDPGDLGSAVQGEDGPVTSGGVKDFFNLSTLLDQPMLHTFWADCNDVEVYRTTTKDSIQSWLNQVKASNVRDWLVILVETPENKKAKQLLPRTSVLDKIKSDFAQKQVERCIGLSDPSKLNSKSAESLQAMLHRLRLLLLASYSKTLTKFEENMRAQREKRNDPGWNFCHYFLLQEELAFVLEMLEVYDDALIQYDELDSLFSQFVVNSHVSDTPQWLLSFQRSGDQWPSLTLSQNSTGILLDVRNKIRHSTVSLVSFRNYLFSRQATLLVKQKRVNELAQRSLAFLHNTINELSILDVSFTEEGATSAWVFVSALEILGIVCGYGQSSLHSGTLNGNGVGDHSNHTIMAPTDFSVHTASLWDYAREKLYELGKLCDLLPQSQPKSDHLHKVISLSAGLVVFQEEPTVSKPNQPNSKTSVGGETKERKSIGEDFLSIQILVTPIEKLKNALSSKDQFQTHYLELCELAMGTFKHIGRIRCARKVGLSLALYYMDASEHQKAIGFLTDALKTFRDDKWNLLVVEVLLKLAICYKATKDKERYLKTTALLASSQQLPIPERENYFEEFMSSLNLMQSGDGIILTSTEDSFTIKSVNVETLGRINADGCDVTVHLEVDSNFSKPLRCSFIEMAVLPAEPHQVTISNQQASAPKTSRRLSGGPSPKDGGGRSKGGSDRKESLLPITCEDEDLLFNNTEINPINLRLDLGQIFETKQDKSIQGGKLMCHNSHLALRRKDSQAKSETELVKTDFSISAKSSNVQIEPGRNGLKLSAKVPLPGAYRLGQISIGLKSFEYISPRLGCRYKFNVERVPGSVTLVEGNSSLIAGIEQFLTLQVETGSSEIKQGMSLNLRASVGLQLKSHENAPLTSEFSITLPPTKSFSSTQVRLKVKAELGPQKDNSVIEHKLMAKCPWASEETKLSVTFVPPFMSSFKIHSTVGSRKFIQVLLHGLSECCFVVSNHQLIIQGIHAKDIPLVPLNPRSQELNLRSTQTASYMFEIGVNEIEDEHPTRLEFSVTFSPFNKSQPPELYKYYFSLTQFKTQYEVKYRVDPHKGVEFCRVGAMCSLVIEIVKVCQSLEEAETSLMYEVRADQHMWAICGRTSGVVSMEGVEVAHVAVDVMPMSQGFLPLPTVYLSKYIPADHKGGSSSVPKLDPFHSGQVFNWCKGTQMHVLPPSQGSTGSTSGHTSALNSLNANDTYF